MTLGRFVQLSILAFCLCQTADAAKHKRNCKNFEFAATGDFDYANPLDPGYLTTWQHTQTVNIIEDINRSKAKFTLGVGDSGNSSPKNQEYIDKKKREVFDLFKRPFITTLGDNDWSQTRSIAPPYYTQLQTLEASRVTYFSGNKSLGQKKMKVARQKKYPENQRFVYRGIVFATFHTIGEYDLIIPIDGVPSQEVIEAEYIARRDANLEWIRKAFACARKIDAKGIVFCTQADHWYRDTLTPSFHNGYVNQYKKYPVDTSDRSNFQSYYELMRDESLQFGDVEFEDVFVSNAIGYQPRPVGGKPVLVIYGDSHRFTMDSPIIYPPGGWLGENESGQWDAFQAWDMPNYLEIQVLGSPRQGWVKIKVDFDDPQLFSMGRGPIPRTR
ncbi:MAG: hypothetical protein JSR37_07075 [Verrucomicrobia bacterium]|nr:hypothetical protein [Verrucomicrobiota bacterium]MBS0637304.1 hypothetical protein [Verrucomicrobiota bacterium]